MGSNEESTWQRRVEQKRQRCANKIPAEWRIPNEVMASLHTPLAEHKTNLSRNDIIRESGIMTQHELQLTEEYTVSELLAALANGRLSSVEVTMAYCKRAAIAQQLVYTHNLLNPISEPLTILGFLSYRDNVCGGP